MPALQCVLSAFLSPLTVFESSNPFNQRKRNDVVVFATWMYEHIMLCLACTQTSGDKNKFTLCIPKKTGYLAQWLLALETRHLTCNATHWRRTSLPQLGLSGPSSKLPCDVRECYHIWGAYLLNSVNFAIKWERPTLNVPRTAFSAKWNPKRKCSWLIASWR